MNTGLQNKAWHILPKEFREEVKRKFQLTDADCIAYEILIDLFGLHNLTSDAEGENDEMLYVSRKKLQYFYRKLRQVGENHAAFALQSLFGSKCLPDEGTDCTPVEVAVAKNTTTSNVDSLDSNVESLEPKSAEPKFKFKKGDKVSRFYDEKVYTVDDYCEDDNLNHYILVDSLGNRVTEIEGNLKLYVGPKYHASEKVRYKGQNHEIGEIVQYWGDEDPGRYSVRFGKEYHNISESMLEPYTEPTANYLRSEGALNTAVLAGNYSSASTCDKQFDNIIKDGFKNHNRLNIAAMAMQGMLSNTTRFSSYEISDLVRISLNCADALISEAEKGDSK